MPRRRYFKKRFHRKPKPPLAVLAGAAVGPAQIIFGGGAFNWPIWKIQNKSDIGNELINRLSMSYLGYNINSYDVNQGMISVQNGGFWGSIGLIAGFLGHWLGKKSGLNRILARYGFEL
ncbi:MAG: hypothetical protein QXV17_10770 [Candidatus Micrarchaeaceae archaeon]